MSDLKVDVSDWVLIDEGSLNSSSLMGLVQQMQNIIIKNYLDCIIDYGDCAITIEKSNVEFCMAINNNDKYAPDQFRFKISIPEIIQELIDISETKESIPELMDIKNQLKISLDAVSAAINELEAQND